MWGMIATWRMALEGVTEAAAALASGGVVRPRRAHRDRARCRGRPVPGPDRKSVV